VHGEEVVEEQISTYYLADEIAGTYRGLCIATPEAEWEVLRELTSEAFAHFPWEWAGIHAGGWLCHIGRSH
jgi:hypothetical protein